MEDVVTPFMAVALVAVCQTSALRKPYPHTVIMSFGIAAMGTLTCKVYMHNITTVFRRFRRNRVV
jgi:hypothetical protein